MRYGDTGLELTLVGTTTDIGVLVDAIGAGVLVGMLSGVQPKSRIAPVSLGCNTTLKVVITPEVGIVYVTLPGNAALATVMPLT